MLEEKDGRYMMNFEAILNSITDNTRMIILSNPHNPVGRAWSGEELTTLGEICLKKNIIILADEIHGDLVLPGYKHTPVASLSEEIAAITISCIAPSKTFNLAGLATSSVIISEKALRKEFTGIMDRLHMGNGNIYGKVDLTFTSESSSNKAPEVDSASYDAAANQLYILFDIR